MRPLQEVLLERDPSGWRMLVGCVLLNVTTRTAVDAVYGEVFRRWPDEGRMARARESTVAGVLEPLGCSNRRAYTLIVMSGDFIALSAQHAEGDEGPIGADEVPELYGLGEYARDSWAIFFEGRRDVEPTDRVLGAYLAGWHAGRADAVQG